MAKPVLFNANAAPGALTYDIQSPGGFHKGDLIVGIANPVGTNSECGSSKVTADPGPIIVPPTCDPNDPVKSANCLAHMTIAHTGTNVPFTGNTPLNVLTAQQSLYQSEDQLAQSEQTVATDFSPPLALFIVSSGLLGNCNNTSNPPSNGLS